MSITAFMDHHFRHFNARETLAAARSYKEFVGSGNKMLLSMAGAMSTAEIGVSLAKMIREDKVHAISCTAANFEEDFFNLVAHSEYEFVPNWRALSTEEEVRLRDKGFNRVTDTCIPETIFRHIERNLVEFWKEADAKGEQYFATEYFFRMLDEKRLEQYYQIDPKDSWVVAAWEKKIPVYNPGFEDSTLGNIFAARVFDGTLKSHNLIKTGTAQMEHLARWYTEQSQAGSRIGFFQIAGGIAGDFAICAVPMMKQDLELDIELWAWFAQISDSTTSYGSYSGAVPNEKITWYKLDPESPKFMINSDASIVAPLIFSYVLGE